MSWSGACWLVITVTGCFAACMAAHHHDVERERRFTCEFLGGTVKWSEDDWSCVNVKPEAPCR